GGSADWRRRIVRDASALAADSADVLRNDQAAAEASKAVASDARQHQDRGQSDDGGGHSRGNSVDQGRCDYYSCGSGQHQDGGLEKRDRIGDHAGSSGILIVAPAGAEIEGARGQSLLQSWIRATVVLK